MSLTPENLQTCVSRLTRPEVAVILPRFQTTAEFRLEQVLGDLGMRDAFRRAAENNLPSLADASGQCDIGPKRQRGMASLATRLSTDKADFSGMSSSRDLLHSA